MHYLDNEKQYGKHAMSTASSITSITLLTVPLVTIAAPSAGNAAVTQSHAVANPEKIYSPIIIDPSKHESNKKALRSILEKELSASKSPEDQARHLSCRIKEIAKLFKANFLADAYGFPQLGPNSNVTFNRFTLWEGGNDTTPEIPLTFFAYVWPSKQFAQTCNPNERTPYYASCIHSHPIPCALAVLQGTFVQRNYEHVATDAKGKYVRFKNEEIFKEGDGDIDDLKKSFIHRVHGNGPDQICISLHAYGLPSAAKVMESFERTRSECSFKEVQCPDVTSVCGCIVQ